MHLSIHIIWGHSLKGKKSLFKRLRLNEWRNTDVPTYTSTLATGGAYRGARKIKEKGERESCRYVEAVRLRERKRERGRESRRYEWEAEERASSVFRVLFNNSFRLATGFLSLFLFNKHFERGRARDSKIPTHMLHTGKYALTQQSVCALCLF